MEIFFAGKWNTGVKKMKWVIVVVTLAWTAFASYTASKMGPLTE